MTSSKYADEIAKYIAVQLPIPDDLKENLIEEAYNEYEARNNSSRDEEDEERKETSTQELR